MATPNGGG